MSRDALVVVQMEGKNWAGGGGHLVYVANPHFAYLLSDGTHLGYFSLLADVSESQ